MWIDLIPTRKLPKGAQTSDHLRGRSVGYYFEVRHFGVPYYIPVSRDLKKLFGIHINKGRASFDIKGHGDCLERVLSDVVASVYLQIRDTVGAEIKQHLDQELKDSFSNMFEKLISSKVDQSFKRRLPAPDGTK